MTLKKIGKMEPLVWGGGRYKIPDVKGFLQLSGLSFEIQNLSWIPPTEETNLQGIIEQAIKSILEDFTYKGEPLFESVIIGDIKPEGLSTALIECGEPVNKIERYNRGKILKTTATCSVTFAFKEELKDARDRRRHAPATLVQYMIDNHYLEVDI